jgi:gliding motility-associated protein GldC
MKTSDIRFTVTLDENQVPERIDWKADDGGAESTCKSVLISLWDAQEQNALRIDLWTKEMTTDEMKSFFHRQLLTMADTFKHMRAFGHYFGEEMLGIEPV